ncbi:MAG: DUF3536 domain-containing protein [Dehalogenimonas sp.]|uniref:DUF3536 domain-containing protein n=1 Tax=Candidatus Dehalogenimonas loeffleri TaxID=3127115 RepID=A0ABZ2J2V9_9CHLR|nr:DUF3536 domain-containing protein [Dehalogenimonas sp.]
MNERYLCIHGHFYQPPRENPWLETIETEESAAPYHNWNERITDECYAANLNARILDNQGRIIRIVNNYTDLSFNFGPTLLSWMQTNHPRLYSGLTKPSLSNNHPGNPIAQPYNHQIMPLADHRDKRTQVIWGIADFRHRFGHHPEGMWLPETAVDLKTLEIMASQGIKYTILASHQAGRFKPPGGEWQELPDGINTSRLYRCALPSGGHINIAFFHPQLSRDVAFGNLLRNGDNFTNRILESFQSTTDTPELITIATDGETFGHHHRFGEMALAYAVDKLKQTGIRVTSIAEYLALNPPDHEVEILENTSWSCDHGIERWRSGCCCSTGKHPLWNQRWRAPLRQAMELLRDRLNPLFESEAVKLLSDPWAARDDYCRVIVNRSSENIVNFFNQWAIRPLSAVETSQALKLLELQRTLMACFTSCGWFFDDIGGLESILVLRQAGRALELSKNLFGTSPETSFLTILETAVSNRPEWGTGRDIYLRNVPPLFVGLEKIAAHFALTSIFENPGPTTNIFNFRVDNTGIRFYGAGSGRGSVGDVVITSLTTGERQRFVFTAFLTGNLLQAGIKTFTTENDYDALAQYAADLVKNNFGINQIQNFLTTEFPGNTYRPADLSPDMQRQIIGKLLADALTDAEESYLQIFNRTRSVMKSGTDLGLKAPALFTAAAERALNSRLVAELKGHNINIPALESVLNEISSWKLNLDLVPLTESLTRYLERLLVATPDEPTLDNFVALLDMFENQGVLPDVQQLQNSLHQLRLETYPRLKDDPASASWVAAFHRLAARLNYFVH